MDQKTVRLFLPHIGTWIKIGIEIPRRINLMKRALVDYSTSSESEDDIKHAPPPAKKMFLLQKRYHELSS